MSDKKISQLSSITTPLQSSDIIPIVRTPNTETLKVSYGDLRDAITGSVPAVDLSGLATTQSLNTFTASYVSDSGSVSNRVSQLEATASASTSSLALTASYAPDYLPLSGGIITGDLTVEGTASIQYLHVTYESSSVLYSSGSNQFGDETTDTQLLIGKVVMTGSVEVSGSVNAPDITGSLFGTASWSERTISSSYPFTVTGSNLYSTYTTTGIPSGSSTNAIWIGQEAGLGSSNLLDANIFIGYRAGRSSSFSDRSVAIGWQALNTTTTSSTNIAIGRSAGASSTQISENINIGQSSGFGTTNNSQSINIGSAAGQSSFFNRKNIAIGVSSLMSSVSSSNTIAIGESSGRFIWNSTGSIIIGNFSGPDNNTRSISSNNIIIGNKITLPSGSRDSINIGGILFGSGSYKYENTVSHFSGSANGRIGINQVTPEYSLDVSGDARITNGLTASLHGTASWAISSSRAISASHADFAVSSSYPLAVTGSNLYSTYLRSGIPTQSSTVHSIWIGEDAGAGGNGINTTILMGYRAGRSGSAMNNTVALGVQAMNLATTSSDSIAIGTSAGERSSQATYNIFIGDNAGQNHKQGGNNVAIGTGAGQGAATSSVNVHIGFSAGAGTSRTRENVSIGYLAGQNVSDASSSIFIGYSAGRSSGTTPTVGPNNIIIGTNVTLGAGRKDSINIGGLIFGSGSYASNQGTPVSSSANGRIGINQPTPEYSLDVSGTFRVTDGMTGSLHGTSSWALNSISASYSLSASQALSASEAQNARDILIYVKNDQASTILKGQVVRISGANGDNALVQTASWDNDALSANTLGIATENIASNDFGQVMTTGKLIGIDTSNFTAGQMLYLGATGSIINYAPTAPLHGVRLGQALRIQGINGSMDVRIDNGYEIGELHDIVDTTTNTTYGDLLVKSGSVWTNSRSLTGSYSLTGSLKATGLLDATASVAISASFARVAISASYFSGSIDSAVSATSASYAATASWALNSITSSYALTASHVLGGVTSASYAATSSWSINSISASVSVSSSFATSASFAQNTISASYAYTASSAVSSSYAVTASHVIGGVVSASYAATASRLEGTASWSVNSISASVSVSASVAISASFAQNTISASYAYTASSAISSSFAQNTISASYAFTASSAVSSSYALSASYAVSSSFSLTSISASVALTSSHFVSSSMWDINTKTADYTLTTADAGKVIKMNVGLANTLTVPTNAAQPFAIGTYINVVQYGTGITSIAGSGGVTINSANGWKRINAQYGGATLIKEGTDSWILVGNLNA